MRKFIKSQDTLTSERERLLFDANLILVSKAANPNSLEWVAKGTEPWRRGEEYRIIQLVQGGWSEGFQCLEDVSEIVANRTMCPFVRPQAFVKQTNESKRFPSRG